VTKKVGPANLTIRFQPATRRTSNPPRCRCLYPCAAAGRTEREHCQIAMEALISAAEKGGIVMLAHIAMLRALNHGDRDPAAGTAPQARQALQDRQMI
jgi:hypothetical protein